MNAKEFNYHFYVIIIFMNLNIHLDVYIGSVTFMSLIEIKLSVIFMS